MLESEMAFATVDYILLWVAAGLAVLGTSFRVYLGMKYSRLIDEVDQMTTTKNRELKRCKVKYEKCYAMNQGVANVGAFVDRFLSKLSLGPFTYLALYQMGAQLILLSVIFMALLICHRILAGDSLLRLLPYYAGCFAGLYVFLAISVVVNVQEKRTVLKISLVDYLENHLTPRLSSVPSNLAKIRGEVPAAVNPRAGMETKVMAERVAGATRASGTKGIGNAEKTGANTMAGAKAQGEKELQVLPTSQTGSQSTEQTKQYQELSKLLEEFFAV